MRVPRCSESAVGEVSVTVTEEVDTVNEFVSVGDTLFHESTPRTEKL